MQEKVKWRAVFEFSDYTPDEVFNRIKEWLDGTPIKVILEFEEGSKNDV